MFRVTKRMEVAGAHHLNLPYESPCTYPHGHNWVIEITMECDDDSLSDYGMVYDFALIKREIHGRLDHRTINEYVEQPTAENIAKWICDLLGEACTQVMVQESEGNRAWYIR